MASGSAMVEAFLKWRGGGPKPMSRFSSPTTQTGSGVARNFKRRGGGSHNFHVFCQTYFFGRTNLKLIKKQERLRGVRGHAPPKIF